MVLSTPFHTLAIAMTLARLTAGFAPTHPTKPFLKYGYTGTNSLLHSTPAFEDGFVEMQKKVSDTKRNQNSESAPPAGTPTDEDAETHLNHQREVFDEMSAFFDSPEATPEDVRPSLRYIVQRALRQMVGGRDGGRFRVLDVGCGTGALFPFYVEAADGMGIELDIVGLDLSEKMAECANVNARRMTEESGKHSVRCRVGDFVETVMGEKVCKESFVGFGGKGMDEDFDETFDAVVINACFGNFIDPNSVVTAAATSLKNDGVFVISHPLGSDFVQKLHDDKPSMVPNLLPTEYQQEVLERYQPLTTIARADNNDNADNKEGVTIPYFASFKKVPCRTLRDFVQLRGPVDQGYGRGGKKLGFPTANLPSSLFSNALTDVPNGVYVGRATIEGPPSAAGGRNVVHKAVVNVGYSPTFEGKENEEKIVEAHLMVAEGAIEGDFYGETMRLELVGFLRPERRFPSFPDLIAAITNDVENAKTVLDEAPYSLYEFEFLKVSQNEEKIWVGTAGGDDNASYEFNSCPFWK